MRLVSGSLLALALGMGGCGSDSGTQDQQALADLSIVSARDGGLAFDGAALGDAGRARCGHPGDKGDDAGIGAWCAQLSDCSATASAHICATLDDPSAHYCTRACDNGGSDGGSSSDGGGLSSGCGSGATCTHSDKLGDLCVPNRCLPALDGGSSVADLGSPPVDQGTYTDTAAAVADAAVAPDASAIPDASGTATDAGPSPDR